MTARRGEVHCLLTAAAIAERVRQLAAEIVAGYTGQAPPVLVGSLKGSWVFMADLVRQLNLPVRCDFVKLSSYGGGTSTSGRIQLQLDMTLPAAGEHLLVIEDIIDTGATTAWLLKHLQKKKPASVRVCALLDKPSRRRVPVGIDYLGFTIPDHFVVGYGIDWAEQYRELPYIGYLEEGVPRDAK